MSEPTAIDEAAYARFVDSVGGDTDFVTELVQTYLSDTPNQLESMRRAAAGGDADGLRRAAHSLKSGSAGFGALALAALCKDLEDAARAGSLAGAPERIQAVEAAYQSVAAALLAKLGVGR